MESLILEPSGYTPRIRFSPVQGTFEITGISLPENIIEFYEPVLDWMDRYENEYIEEAVLNGRANLEVMFKLDYYNSGTIRYLISILNKIKRFIDRGMNVTVSWYYDKDDEHLLDSGKDLAVLTGLPVHFKAT
jgi:hypothetical protein